MVAKLSTPRARDLRKQTTDAESLVWAHVRNRALAGAKFKRQVPIAGFYADFVCIESKLIIEIDGGQHDTQRSTDAARTKKLEAAGYRVLRFWNHEVLTNIEGVLETIMHSIAKPK
ncbi:MAG: endonuclease domain-containing protein [Rhodospirillaceae bacterium]|nr:endonuclease domain-containing protein [Rhodospirillaceae bacterium]